MWNIDHALYWWPHNFAQVGRSACKQVQVCIIKLLGNVVASRTTRFKIHMWSRRGEQTFTRYSLRVCIQPEGAVHHVSASGSVCFLRSWIKTFAGANSFVYIPRLPSRCRNVLYVLVRLHRLAKYYVTDSSSSVIPAMVFATITNVFVVIIPFSRTGEADARQNLSARSSLPEDSVWNDNISSSEDFKAKRQI